MGESNVQPSRVELTLRECLLADAIESANDIERDKLKADLKASRDKVHRLVDMCRAKDVRIKALEALLLRSVTALHFYEMDSRAPLLKDINDALEDKHS
jgi:uncharacterized protein (UPF0371 family)